MKHLLNNLSEEEKNSIREQHEGGMKLDTSRFRTLLEGKSGNVKPLVEQYDDFEEDDTCPQCGRGGYSYESGCEDCDDEENEYRWDAEDDEEELDEDDNEKPLNLLQRFYMYLRGTNSEISELPDDFFNEFIEDISDESTSDILVDVIRLNNPEFREFEERELGYSQHDGDFGGDDSEEELDLREFDDLEEDEDTW